MPLFEHQCEEHGRFEVLQARGPGADYSPCPVCDIPAPLVWSTPVMRPDTYWAGQVHRNYGYHTSATSLKAEMKRRNHVEISGRNDREDWEKIADNARKDQDAKLKKDVRKWSEKTFGPSGLGLGGADGEKFIKENS